MATELEYAWAAGFFDGEGTVGINRKKNPTGNHTYTLVVRVSQKDPSPLFHLMRIMECGLIHVTRHKHLGVPSHLREWVITGKRARRCLKSMLPYFTLKAERAKLAIEFQDENDRGRRGPKGLTAEQRILRDSYYQQMLQLNRTKTAKEWAAAETKSSGRSLTWRDGCDSPIYLDDKKVEVGRNDQPAKETLVVH